MCLGSKAQTGSRQFRPLIFLIAPKDMAPKVVPAKFSPPPRPLLGAPAKDRNTGPAVTESLPVTDWDDVVHRAYVEAVKSVQRNNAGNEAWQNHVADFGQSRPSGGRESNPSVYDTDFLKSFLDMVESFMKWQGKQEENATNWSNMPSSKAPPPAPLTTMPGSSSAFPAVKVEQDESLPRVALPPDQMGSRSPMAPIERIRHTAIPSFEKLGEPLRDHLNRQAAMNPNFIVQTWTDATMLSVSAGGIL